MKLCIQFINEIMRKIGRPCVKRERVVFLRINLVSCHEGPLQQQFI